VEHEIPLLFNLEADIGEEEALSNLNLIEEVNRQADLFKDGLKIRNSILDIQYIDPQ